nr:MAG TPA: putative outer membrane protein [Caudoviricetes sp.]
MKNKEFVKLYKKITLIVFSLLTFLLLILINNNAYAAVDMTLQKGKLNSSEYYHVEQRDLWKNEYIYCIDPNKIVYEGDYKVSASFEVDSKKGKYATSDRQGIQAWILANDGILGYSKYNLTTQTYEQYLKTSVGQHLMWMSMGTPCYRLPYKDFTYKGNTYKKWYYYDSDGNKKEYQGGNETYGPLWGTMPYVVEEEWKKIVGDPDNIVADMYPGYLNLLNYFKERKSIKKNNDSKLKVYYDADKSPVDGVSGSSITSDYDWKEKYMVIGPMTFDVATGDWLKDIKIDYTKNGEKYYNQSITSENTDIIACEKNVDGGFDGVTESDFKTREEGTYENILDYGCIYGKYKQPEVYILIKKDAGITSIDNIKITVGRGEIKAWWYELKLSGQQTLLYGDGNVTFENTNLNFKSEPLIPPVQVELNKVDTAKAAVEGAQFSITYSNGLKGETKTVGKDGKIVFSQVQPTSPDEFTATITETFTPAGYKKLEKPIVLKFTYDQNKAVWKVEKISGPDEKITIGTVTKDSKSGINKIPVTVENKSIIEKLTLLKTSSVGGGKVEGAKFKLTLTNIASIKGYKIPTTGTPTIIVTTDKNGNIVLEDIEIADLSKDIVITMEETEAPVGYKKIEGKITVTLKRKGNTYTIHKAEKENTVTDDEFKAGEVTLINHELVLNIKDIPIMNLGGIVWTEKIQTDKATAEINNKYDGENQDEALAGIKVTLYKNGKKVTETTSSDGNQKATYTNYKGNKVEVDLAKGEYMFTDITAGNDYYVVFEYDGIKYQAMTNSKEQAYTTKARDTKISEEPNRKDFNDNTKTISGNGEVDKSKTNTGWIIEYDLDNDSTPNKAIYRNIKNENGELQYVEGKTYTYLSKTEDWMGTWNTDGTINKSHYAFNINCGLSKKLFDLSLGTDVKDATVAINGNQTTYTYDQILDGKLDKALNRPSSDKNINYNLYLAVSDYNYRIGDYKVPGEGSIENKYDAEALNKEQIDSAKKDSELEVYVTYRIELKNQSTQHDAKVNLVEYHFDEHYQYVSIKNATAEKDPNARVLYITPDEGIEAGRTLLPNIEITFKVLPDGKGNKCVLGEDYLNQAEIISYTTGGGLVDEDSAPGNAFLEENKIRYEDDTDEANGIQIKLKDNAERSISGKVFDTENNSVNDVIVQLIELVEINNKQYEYIWQETVAGSNTVKTTDRNGYPGKSYSFTDDNKNKAGEYKFTQGIIPGNYIVRFIYGDGSAYEITENTLKYNGEDYKSTYVDYNYNAEWYNNISLDGEKSKAVDNEARRLKVMSYAVDVDGTKGAELALLSKPIGTNNNKLKDVLDNTWMCAETLKIKMPVDTDIKENVSNDSTVDNGNAPSTENTQFNNVNLGLMERPKTKLVLEKHITGLTIKPVASGVNLIANATADINDILKATQGSEIELKGQKDGLFATKSGRTNRGLWYLQTDTTELAQGADAYITYTYVIKNEGDDDYLNEDLIAFYINDINGYVNKLSDLGTEVKNAKKQVTGTAYTNGTYISNFYYTGHATGKDKKVLASVEELQESLNPKVKFLNSTTDFSKTDRNSNIKYAYYDTNGNMQENDSSINEIITSTTGTGKMELNGRDTSKKLVVSVGLSASEIENGGVYDSYIAQVTHYTNAAGRRDQSTPANLSYVHSEDTGITLDKYNEEDEFWAETFRITKPTGEDKITPVQIAIITISAVAVLGVGIILIKKFVLKK